jgi:excisionase family DNA binding protein
MFKPHHVISISEAAEMCQVTPETIRRWTDQGEIPSTRTLGGHRRINLKDFHEFLNKRKLVNEEQIEQSQKLTLIVGDDKQRIEELKETLISIAPGTEIFQVESAFDAGLLTVLEEPDCIIFANETPGLDVGYAIRSIRGNARTRMIRIVTICDGRGGAKKLGADFSISSPTDAESLSKAFLQ